MNKLSIVILIFLSHYSYAGDRIGGGGGGGGKPSMLLQSIQNFRLAMEKLNDDEAEATLDQIENVTLKDIKGVKYIRSNSEAFEYLQMRDLESIQLVSGQLITQ